MDYDEKKHMSEGTEGNYFEFPCTRGVTGAQFSSGLQDFPLSIGAGQVWYPKRSYFKVTLSLLNAAGTAPILPKEFTCLADNALGSLYDNAYFRAGGQDVSSIVQYSAQASALKVRMKNSLPWLRSMGAVSLNEADFGKRVAATSMHPEKGLGAAGVPSIACASQTRMKFYDPREMYKPIDEVKLAANPNNFAAVQVQIRSLVTAGAVGAGITLGQVDSSGGDLLTDFLQGMPLGSFPATASPAGVKFGGPLLAGDILVVNGVEYEVVLDVTEEGPGPMSATTCFVTPAPAVGTVALTNDWFVIRADRIRSPQSFCTLFGIWQPPLSIFDYDGPLGAGDYRIQLNPSSSFDRNAVETRNPNWQAASPYSLTIQDVRFYGYIEKMSIPDQIHNLDLTEMSVQSKPYSSNLQFSVPPSTNTLTVWVQDTATGGNPLYPPSMFKIRDNSDLYLQYVQLTYANQNKPATNWQSQYSVYQSEDSKFAAFNLTSNSGGQELQQRYRDSYWESGLDVALGGCESFTDWLRRGPFYTFSFEKDVNNKATEVQVNMMFNNPTYPNSGALGPPTTTQSTANMVVYLCAYYRKTAQLTTRNGLIVQVSTREV